MTRRAARKPVQPSSRTLAKLIEKVSEIPRCCSSVDCLSVRFPNHLEEILRNRNEMVLTPFLTQKRSVLDFLQKNTDPATKVTTWSIFGLKVCKASWAFKQGVSERTLRDYEKEWREGISCDSVFHGNLGTQKQRSQT
jgi:hypothetical protein